MKNFLSQFLGMTINVILIYILFFSFGVPTVVKYGYPFETNRKTVVTIAQAADGSIPSGVYGSGVFPYSLFLMILGTGWIIKEYYCFFYNPSVKELERRMNAITISKRLGNMKQMSTLRREYRFLINC
ncbi:hypothetical protein WA538_000077 [Blastocystis sp. DL]